MSGLWTEAVKRSLITLKALTYAPTESPPLQRRFPNASAA
jgi:hypothetical protein